MEVKIGCCGFPVARHKYWQNFKVVELQQTFYQLPTRSIIEKWKKQSPLDAEFTIKAWQLITHLPTSPTYRRLKMNIPEKKKKNYGFFTPSAEVFKAWEEIDKIAQILQTKIIIFQTPASFTPCIQNINNLKKFFTTIQRRNYIFVWEARGEWTEKQIFRLCEHLNLIHGVDPFKNKALYGEIRYYRLHGKQGYQYKYNLEDLKFLEKLVYAKWPKIYFMFNNIYMFENAVEFQKLLIRNRGGKET